MTAIWVLLSLFFLGCKKEFIQVKSNDPMKQIYYTEEGLPYVLKVISDTNFIGAIAVPTNVARSVIVNQDKNTFVNPYQLLELKTSKRIIPVQFACGYNNIIAGVSTQQVNVQQVYFTVANINGVLGQSTSALMKNAANVEALTNPLSDTNNFNIKGVKYGQITYKESDFMDPSNGVVISFQRTLGESLVQSSVNANTPVLPVGNDYRNGVSFMYFELQ